MLASQKGHEKVIYLLLKHNMKVNTVIHCKLHSNALQAAAYGGHEKVIQLPLDQGADFCGYNGNTLQAASSKDYERIVQKLLGNGADEKAPP